MRRKMKRMLAIAMSVVLAAGMAGCGQKPSEEAKTDNVTEAQEAAGTGEELEVVRVLGNNYTFTGANGRTVTLKDWAEEGKSKRWQKLTEDLAERGIKLELDLIESDQFETTCQTMAASGEFSNYDLIQITPLDDKTKINLVRQGQLQPISDIWEQHSEGPAKEFFESDAGKYFYNHLKLEDGKCYWISDFGSSTYKGEMETNFALGFSIRQDWLDAIGREIPKTTEELYEDLVEFQKQDVNKSGAADEFICVWFDNFSTDIAQWFGLGTGLTFFNTQDNNTVTSPWYQEHVKEYITYMQKLYAAGVLKMSGNEFNTYLANNQVAGIADWTTMTWMEATISLPEGAAYPWYVPFRAQAVEGQVPLFRGPNVYNPGFRAYAVPASSDKQDAVGKLLDYLVSDECILLTEYGIEGVSYEMVDGQYSNIIDASLENTDATGIALWTNGGIFPRFELNKDVNGEMVTSTQIAKEKGVKNNASGKEDYNIDCFNDPTHRLFHDETAYAVPTLDEISKISEISSDLSTYSSELLTKLIMGEKSLDDWDAYIQDLKDLGLDELIAINQGRYDRAMK